jgi:hypothetical protein
MNIVGTFYTRGLNFLIKTHTNYVQSTNEHNDFEYGLNLTSRLSRGFQNKRLDVYHQNGIRIDDVSAK